MRAVFTPTVPTAETTPGRARTTRPPRPSDASLRRPTPWLIPVALMAAAALWRLLLLGRVFTNVDSDQAIVGVMADHIRAGGRPLMYDGQPYQGACEAYAAAALSALFGAGDWALRLPMLLCSALLVGAVYLLGATLYGRGGAALSALVVALGPAMLMYYGDVTGFGYVEVALLGTVLLILQARHPDPRGLPLLVALAMGVLAGLGLWIEPLMAEYLLPLGLAYALPLLTAHRPRPPHPSGAPDERAAASAASTIRERPESSQSTSTARRPRPRAASLHALAPIAAAAGFLIGGAPLVAYNLRHHWATLSYLFGQSGQPVDHLAVARRLVTESLPVLVGLTLPGNNAAAYAHRVALYPAQHALGVAAGLYILGRLLLARDGLLGRAILLARSAAGAASAHHRRGWRGDRVSTGTAPVDVSHARPRDGALALFAASPPLFFVCTHFGAGDSAIDTARYLLPLYSATPLIVRVLLPRRSRRPAVTAGVASLVTAGLLATSMALTLAAPQDLAPRGPIGGLIGLLEARGVRVAYTNYWMAYQLTWESRERVLGVPVNGARLARVRVPSDLDVAARTPAGGLGWIFGAGGPDERQFRLRLARTHTRASRARWANLAIYDHLSRPLRAAGPFENAGQPWFDDAAP